MGAVPPNSQPPAEPPRSQPCCARLRILSLTNNHDRGAIKVRKAVRHLIKFLPVRSILAALILCSLGSAALPLSSVSAISACHLDCCAGRAPHSAGSCMTGACHARIKSKRHAHAEPLDPTISEELCGLSMRPTAVAKRIAAAKLSGRKTASSESTQSELSKTSAGRPCPPDCGGLASAFANAKQSRKAFAGRTHSLRSQSVIGPSDRFVHSVKSRAGLSRRSIPRGPPPSFA
jgi:hypothetical protein